MYKIYNENNMDIGFSSSFNLIYADFIYDNLDFSWVDKYWHHLKPNSIFMAQTDDSSMAQLKLKLDSMPNAIWLNTCITIQEWGGVPRKAFPRKHDYIFIYANGENYFWDGDRIQIRKATAGTAFDKKGTGLKTPCDVFYDLGNFSTMSKERIKNAEGRNVRWQKPLFLFDRIFLPFTNNGDWILDPFMGVGSVGEWCIKNKRNYVGIEIDKEIYSLAHNRIMEAEKNF